jgi:hypothetical protein
VSKWTEDLGGVGAGFEQPTIRATVPSTLAKAMDLSFTTQLQFLTGPFKRRQSIAQRPQQ